MSSITKKQNEENYLIRSPFPYEPASQTSNLATLLRATFDKYNRQIMLADNQHQWTGAQLLERTGRIACGLMKQVDLKLNQVVFMMCDHSLSEVEVALGAIRAGAAIFGTSPSDGLKEISVLCNLVKPDMIVTNNKWYNLAAELRQMKELDIQKLPIVLLDRCESPIDENGNLAAEDCQFLKNVFYLDDLLLEEDDEALLVQQVDKKIVPHLHNVFFSLTSGSTGRPKAVPQSHSVHIASMQSLLPCTQDSATMKRIFPLDSSKVVAGDLPLDHGAGISCMLASMIKGCKFVVLPSYEEDIFWHSIGQHKITTCLTSTTFLYKLLSRLKQVLDAGQTDHFDLSSLEYLSCAGSKFSFKDLALEIQQKYPKMRISQFYGSTETCFISILGTQDCRTQLPSVGHLVAGVIGKIVEPSTGRLLGPNQQGELLLKAPAQFSRYICHKDVDSDKVVRECHDSQRFYKTGDLCHYDEEGRIYVHGRIKETLFLAEDWKILPAELEEELMEHPLVEACAVVGLPDPQLPGCHAPKAFVQVSSEGSSNFRLVKDERLKEYVRQKNHSSIEEDIYKFMANRTATPKHLRGGVRIIEEFPRNGPLNKIDRRALANLS